MQKDAKVECSQTERIEWIDVAKGILMIMVVYNHIYGEGYLHNLISTFHMPAFFILSGILFKNTKSICGFICRKIYTLLIPFFVFELIGTVITNIFFYEINFKGFLYNTVTLRVITGADWFLFALFCSVVLVTIAYRISDSKILHGCVIVVCGFISVLLPQNHLCIVVGWVVMATLFIELGYIFKSIFESINRYLLCAFIVITLIVPVLNGKVGIALLLINNPILFFGGAVSGSYVIYCLSRIKYFTILKWIGENSLVVMGTHQQIIAILKFYGVENHLFFLLVIMIEVPIIILFNKCLPFLIGKYKFTHLNSKNLNEKEDVVR